MAEGMATMLHVTFDTNVCTALADPGKDASRLDCVEIRGLRAAIEERLLAPYVSEGGLSLEALPREERIDGFLRKWAFRYPGPLALPPPPPQAVREFEWMLRAGYRVLHAPRIALGSLLSIPEAAWAVDARYSPEERANRHNRFIRSHAHVGLCQLKSLGAELVKVHGLDTSRCMRLPSAPSAEEQMWMEGIVAEFDSPRTSNSPRAFAGKVRGIMADWFDIDIVASHHAYGLDFFCTCDEGRASGTASILHGTKRGDLERVWGVKAVNPKELLAEL